jgi:hypothetical protein
VWPLRGHTVVGRRRGPGPCYGMPLGTAHRAERWRDPRRVASLMCSRDQTDSSWRQSLLALAAATDTIGAMMRLDEPANAAPPGLALSPDGRRVHVVADTDGRAFVASADEILVVSFRNLSTPTPPTLRLQPAGPVRVRRRRRPARLRGRSLDPRSPWSICCPSGARYAGSDTSCGDHLRAGSRRTLRGTGRSGRMGLSRGGRTRPRPGSPPPAHRSRSAIDDVGRSGSRSVNVRPLPVA